MEQDTWQKNLERSGKLILLFTGVTLSASQGCAEKQEAKPPNILLITADDLGLQLNCYGDSTVSTPHIDQLARAGVRFTRAYVTQASCSPSRSSIFTGLYPHQNGQIGLSHRGEFAMVPGLITLPGMFREAGYATGVIGKVHVQPSGDFPFDYNTNKGFPANETKDVIRVRDSAVSFFDRYGGEPFFLMVNYFDPHRPYRSGQVNGLPEKPITAEDVKGFPFLPASSEQVLQDIAGYYNCVKRLDDGVGLLMKELQARELLDNTLVIFLGDHGPPFPRAKVSSYEAGIRIPMIMVWPGKVDAGSTREDFVSTIDLFPTLAEAIRWEKQLPGEGYSLLQGPTSRDYLFAEYNAHQSTAFHPQRCVRNQQYKLILTLLEDRFFRGDKYPRERLIDYFDVSREDLDTRPGFKTYLVPEEIQLYNLEEDPWEMNNLAGKPELDSVQHALLEVLDEWRQRTGDPFLDREVLNAMTREQDSLAEAGVRRDHSSALDFISNK